MSSQPLQAIRRALKVPAVHKVVALATVPATIVGLQQVTEKTGVVNVQKMMPGLLSPDLWLVLGMVAFFGALGGIASELLTMHGNIELPHRLRPIRVRRGRTARRTRGSDPRHELDLGIVSRLLLGASAALALLSVYEPENATVLLTNALIAGSAATWVFRLVQGRLLGSRNSESPDRAGAAADSTPEAAAKPKLAVLPKAESAAAR